MTTSTIMTGENKVEKKAMGVPTVDQDIPDEITLNDKLIEELYLKKGNRKEIRIKGADYLNGLILRYSPKTQRKVFVLSYKFNNQREKLTLGNFIPGEYGSVQITEELIRLRKKYYKEGKWKYSPRDELLTIKELEAKTDYKVRDIIKKCIEEEFPRITKIGKLDEKTQRSYSRLYLGLTDRYQHLNFKNDDKEYGRITLKGIADFKTLWQKYPQDKKQQSIYDSKLGSAFIKEVNKGILELYILKTYTERGSRKNLLKALQYLWNYADVHLKAFGGNGLQNNPTHKVNIPQSDDIKFKGTVHNDYSFSPKQLKEVERVLKDISVLHPFSSEAILLTSCSRFRLTEALKLKKSDVKADHIVLRKEIQKDRAKGRQKDIKILFNEEIVDLLVRLNQHKLKHQQTSFSPWLFPNIKADFDDDKPGCPRLKDNSYTMRETWGAVMKQIDFQGSPKTLRKTFITTTVERNKSLGMTEDEAIRQTAKLTHKENSQMVKKVYYKPDTSIAEERAKELGKVLTFKLKS